MLRQPVVLGVVTFVFVAGLFGSACSDAGDGPGARGGGGSTGSGGSISVDSGPQLAADGGPIVEIPDAPTGACKNLQCQQVSCSGDAKTTLSGTVYAPNGTLPLFNALVYVPNAALPPLPSGLACDRCGTLPPGEPVVAALTDHRGEFVLENVPAGTNIPLVVQVGKWRRQIRIPEVRACEDNRLTDPEQTRLPRNRSEGDMPRIAITTGACDNLICLMPKLGIDPEEWGIAGQDKVVTFFAGNANPPDAAELARYDANLRQMTRASELWGNFDELQKYDMAVLSCECEESLDTKGPAAYDAVTRYLAQGGRLFGTDYQYVWYKYSTDPALQSALGIQGFAPDGTNPVLLDTSFPKGKALADWILNLDPTAAYGEVSCSQVFDNFTSATGSSARSWGNSTPLNGADDDHPRFITVNTPAGVPVAEQCGRAVHLDAHITSTFTKPINSYPADCGTAFEDGEEVLAFFFFDVAACIQDDAEPVTPPPVVE
jgi:hypothetical protein